LVEGNTNFIVFNPTVNQLLIPFSAFSDFCQSLYAIEPKFAVGNKEIKSCRQSIAGTCPSKVPSIVLTTAEDYEIEVSQEVFLLQKEDTCELLAYTQDVNIEDIVLGSPILNTYTIIFDASKKEVLFGKTSFKPSSGLPAGGLPLWAVFVVILCCGLLLVAIMLGIKAFKDRKQTESGDLQNMTESSSFLNQTDDKRIN